MSGLLLELNALNTMAGIVYFFYFPYKFLRKKMKTGFAIIIVRQSSIMTIFFFLVPRSSSISDVYTTGWFGMLEP